MATNQEGIDNLRREIEESRAETAETLEAIQRVVTYIQSVPAMVQDAVRKATEANPGADLTELSLLANELNAQQAQLDEAQLAINGVLSTAQAPLPEVEPTPSAEPAEPTGEGEFLSPEPTPTEDLQENETGEGSIG